MRLNAFSSTDYPPPPSPAKRAVEARVKARVEARVEARVAGGRAGGSAGAVGGASPGGSASPGGGRSACACALLDAAAYLQGLVPLNLQTVSYERCSFLKY